MGISSLTAFNILSIAALIGGSALAVFSRIPKQTIANQKDLIETYERRLKALEDQSMRDQQQHIESVKAIADLQGQIKVYKELPLQEIARTMQEMSKVNKTIAQSNVEILKTLRSSALIAAQDKEDLLVAPQVIEEQTVHYQTIEKQGKR